MARNVRKSEPSDTPSAPKKSTKKGDSESDTKKMGGRRRADWERNHVLIRTVLVERMRSLKRMPQIGEISQQTGLSYRTVERHIKKVDFDGLVERSAVRLLTEDVLTGMAKAGINGSPRAAELFFEIVHGYRRVTKTELTGADGGPIEIDGISDDRRTAAVRALLESAAEGSAGSDTEE